MQRNKQKTEQISKLLLVQLRWDAPLALRASPRRQTSCVSYSKHPKARRWNGGGLRGDCEAAPLHFQLPEGLLCQRLCCILSDILWVSIDMII